MLALSYSKPLVNWRTITRFSPLAIYSTLRLIWVFIVIAGELGSVYWTLAKCHWPSIDNIHVTKLTHVLLIGDTQVQTLLPLVDFSFLLFSRRALSDLSLRKHWHIALHLNPDAIIFLGDMLANGKGARTITEYEKQVGKFKRIFDTGTAMEVHYVPGNEDVGLGSIASSASDIRSYYALNFGPLNAEFVIANHTFVGLDAPGLVDEDYQRHAKHATFEEWKVIPHGPISFVKEVSRYGLSNVILLSHIPLSHSEMASCGPHRERRNIRRSAGPGYQNMLGKDTTLFLLNNLDPLVVFSGDNHDYCDYTHVVPGSPSENQEPKSVREVTVKSFASSPHIKRPGFQLLSLVDPVKASGSDTNSFADSLCLLPDQHNIHMTMYLPSLLVTFIILITLQYRTLRRKPLRKIDTRTAFTPSPRSSGRNTPVFNTDSAQLPYFHTIFGSPCATLPSDTRTPHSSSASTVHPVASMPGSPTLSSPTSFLGPSLSSRKRSGDYDDVMYATHYVSRRDSYVFRHKEDVEWAHVREEEECDVGHNGNEAWQGLLLSTTRQYQFLPELPGAKHSAVSKHRPWFWSYTFVFKGRMRRISLSLPSWGALNNLLDFLELGADATITIRKRRRGVVALPMAGFSILWPAMIVWVIINGMMF
ncbi:hypothetical protein HYPSUDRAFT_129610 [Hypholoma sublateritium FD-334 SS-4]|uniref:Calcineurin-like phosphoesterase domain-containing protein n=1 Tax=Hypholoma sublateritium (strain FD-334 SS-4) TaxID=945553 RepID=A0A0D2PIQ2_HYPSF|nr:hypothetical protein HYPSUDRAFT_129610 [Hypholoma sublateritium FD-334 SS-4]